MGIPLHSHVLWYYLGPQQIDHAGLAPAQYPLPISEGTSL